MPEKLAKVGDWSRIFCGTRVSQNGRGMVGILIDKAEQEERAAIRLLG
jgi:hypothetical protein